MQIIELYIKGSTRLEGTAESTLANNLIGRADSNFLGTVKIGDLVENQSTAQNASVTAVVSSTQLTISNDIFISGQDYRITNDFARVDLFGDESVSISDSILNIRDISKVFTPFSQQFNLPASKTNNKLFRHYENTDVLNSYDARFRSDAIIKLNGLDYKKGKIQFKSVKLKGNVAYSIQVIFYGDTVELKDILGEKELSSLDFGDVLDFEYTEANVLSRFINQGDIAFPLITHSKNMRLTNNGYRDNILGTPLEFGDLKPAIRAQEVIEAITRTYPQLTFNGGYFNSIDFSKLYLWMHKNEGFLSNANEGGGIRTISNRWNYRPSVQEPNVDWDFISATGNGADWRTARSGEGQFTFILSVVSTVDPSAEYTVIFKRASDNTVYNSFENLTGNNSLETRINPSFEQGGFIDLIIEIQAESTLALTQSLTVERFTRPSWQLVSQGVASYVASNASTENTINVSDMMPKVKIIDFLSNLFKMFNLVVYKENNNISVIPAVEFSRTGKAWDITRYVDVSTSTVERLFQYKNMVFDFKSKKSFLVQFSDEIQQNFFSRESYGDDEYDGGDYKVEVDFEKMMYERLNNEDTGALSNIGQGAMLNKKFEPTVGKPLLLYIEPTDAGGSFSLGDTVINTYNRPTQIAPLQSFGGDRVSLNFGVEADEYIGTTVDNGDNLFNTGYLDYVETAFNIRSRLLKVSAYLPLGIITKYKMNDIFVIANKPYRINKITTNLLTNKTDLELYSRLETVTEIENGQSAFLRVIPRAEEGTVLNNSININFDNISSEPNIVGYDYYVNRGLIGTLAPTATSLTVTSGIVSNTTYTIDIRAKYLIGSDTGFSYDTTLIVQTPK